METTIEHLDHPLSVPVYSVTLKKFSEHKVDGYVEENLDVEVRRTVTGNYQDTKSIKFKQVGSFTAATLIYKGHYTKLPIWKDRFVVANQLHQSGKIIEAMIDYSIRDIRAVTFDNTDRLILMLSQIKSIEKEAIGQLQIEKSILKNREIGFDRYASIYRKHTVLFLLHYISLLTGCLSKAGISACIYGIEKSSLRIQSSTIFFRSMTGMRLWISAIDTFASVVRITNRPSPLNSL